MSGQVEGTIDEQANLLESEMDADIKESGPVSGLMPWIVPLIVIAAFFLIFFVVWVLIS